MRFESSVTSVSWIPSESVSGLYKAGFAVGVSHPDAPPPDVIKDLAGLDGLSAARRFRFANHLAPGSRFRTATSWTPGTPAVGTSPAPGSGGARSGR
jgi:hypothetical protein